MALIDLIYIKKEKNEYKLDFKEFYDEYNNNYKKYIDMELFRISKNKKIKVYVKEDQDKNISVSSLKYINLELENAIIYTYKNLIDNMDKSAQNLIVKLY